MNSYSMNIYKTLFAIRQKNLVYNHDFLYYSNRKSEAPPEEYGHPDGWVYTGDGKIGLNTEDNSCLIKIGSNNSILSQALHEFPHWEKTLLGKVITAKAHIYLESDTVVSLSLSDGITTEKSTVDTTGNCELQVQLEVNKNATSLILKIESSTAGVVINISKVYANIGSIALDTNPCIINGVIGERKQYISTEHPPAEELSLCDQSKELAPNYTRLNSVLNKRFGVGENNLSLLPDMRGYFSRSWNNGSSTDPDAKERLNWGESEIQGDHVGTLERDEFKKHDHSMPFSELSMFIGNTVAKLVSSGKTPTAMTGGNETRPINIAELYTIKWA